MTEVCKFKFRRGVSKAMIETQIALAIVMAEYTFGQPRVRLYAGYVASDGKAVIDVSSDVGEYVAQVFTGLMTREFGEDNFTVDRIKKKDDL